MIKYESSLVTFTEVPDEITLCFNLTNCPCRCEQCFEPWLREDIGTPLTIAELEHHFDKHPHISCICFMGGDNNHQELYDLILAFKFKHPLIKIAMYSGLKERDLLLMECLDYYKVGPYCPKLGPLNKITTNQRFYKKISHAKWEDITYRFQEIKR